MSVRSLRQEEAVERAALLSVTSYDIAIDLTDLVDGPAFRAVSTIRFTATAGASTFVDCCAEVESATLNGEPLPAAEEGRIALSRPGAGQRARRGHRPGRHRPRPRRPPRCRPGRQERLPLDHLRARRGALRVGVLRPARPQGTARVHRDCAGGVDRRQQLRRPGHREGGRGPSVDLRADAAAVDVQPRRRGRPLLRDPHGGRWLRPRPLRAPDPGVPRSSATPSSSSRSPRRVSSSSATASGCPSRSGSTTRCSCPSSAGRWRTTAA